MGKWTDGPLYSLPPHFHDKNAPFALESVFFLPYICSFLSLSDFPFRPSKEQGALSSGKHCSYLPNHTASYSRDCIIHIHHLKFLKSLHYRIPSGWEW